MAEVSETPREREDSRLAATYERTTRDAEASTGIGAVHLPQKENPQEGSATRVFRFFNTNP